MLVCGAHLCPFCVDEEVPTNLGEVTRRGEGEKNAMPEDTDEGIDDDNEDNDPHKIDEVSLVV